MGLSEFKANLDTQCDPVLKQTNKKKKNQFKLSLSEEGRPTLNVAKKEASWVPARLCFSTADKGLSREPSIYLPPGHARVPPL